MKLGLITTGIVGHPFEEGLDVAQRLGFAAIELGCGGFHSKRYANPHALLSDPDALARWRAAFEQRGLEISALAIHGAPLDPDPDAAARYVDELGEACALAERLGVTQDVCREEDRLTFFFQTLDQISNLASPNRVQPAHRFVQKDQFRIVNDRLSNPHSLQHTFGEFSKLDIARIRQPHTC